MMWKRVCNVTEDGFKVIKVLIKDGEEQAKLIAVEKWPRECLVHKEAHEKVGRVQLELTFEDFGGTSQGGDPLGFSTP